MDVDHATSRHGDLQFAGVRLPLRPSECHSDTPGYPSDNGGILPYPGAARQTPGRTPSPQSGRDGLVTQRPHRPALFGPAALATFASPSHVRRPRAAPGSGPLDRARPGRRVAGRRRRPRRRPAARPACRRARPGGRRRALVGVRARQPARCPVAPVRAPRLDPCRPCRRRPALHRRSGHAGARLRPRSPVSPTPRVPTRSPPWQTRCSVGWSRVTSTSHWTAQLRSAASSRPAGP